MASNQFTVLRGPDAQQSRVQDNISAVLSSVAKALQNTPIMGAPPPAWILPELQNGFIQFAAGTATCAFHKDALGYVHCGGLVKSPAGVAANTLVFTLPIGYRPAAVRIFPVRGTGGTFQAVSVLPTGAVTTELLIAVNGDASLEFSFLAEV